MENATQITTEIMLQRLYRAGWRWHLIRFGGAWMAAVVRNGQGGGARGDSPEEALQLALRQAYQRAEHDGSALES